MGALDSGRGVRVRSHHLGNGVTDENNPTACNTSVDAF